ncbi:MAG: MATE family efflux transporter [Lachnospiraceae bacterium]|nr:MATE family efflux transporter [Lachnospiraceae bacterium]
MKDMTRGKPLPLIVTFAIPIVLSAILQQCYNMADSIIAGNFAENGMGALAAVGVSTPITQLFVGLGVGAGAGTGAVISQTFGAGRLAEVKTTVYTALMALLVMSLVLMGVGVVFSPALATLLGTPGNIYDNAVVYLSIYMWGLPFLFMYNIANAIFQALGDSKKPLYFLIFSTVFNIALDLLFVAKFHWGVAGVAWATFIAQGSAAVLAVSVLLRKTAALAGKVPVYDGHKLAMIAKVGIPTMIQNAIVNVGNLFVSRLVNSYGSDFIAGYSSAIKIMGFFNMVIISVGNAIATFTGQNIGAGNTERPKQGFRIALMLNWSFVTVITVVTYLFGRQMIGLFADATATETMYAAGVNYLRVAVLGSYLFTVLNASVCVCRGSGYVFASTFITLLDLIVRVLLAYGLNGWFGSDSIALSVAIGWGVGAAVGMCFYLKGTWKKKRLV